PESTGVSITTPGIIILEGKNDDSEYNAIVVEAETTGEAVGVNDVLFSSTTKWEDTRASDSKLRDHVTWFGTHALRDDTTSGQKFVTITHPDGQTYVNLKVGNVGGSSDTGKPQLGSVLVTDSELSSVQSKNLVVVGGSCVNSVAASLVGGAYCGSAWTSATGVGTGQFVIQSYANPNASSKVALLVAGYEREDTVNAATYLKNKPQGVIDTTVGKKYVGTSGTQASLTVQ
ncbi:MAG: hypothetical protein Q8P81_03135, partial [Nanoarchaeota archaeon]|nr:hypothetical protein [Nanoarchaeota archaeon]